MENNRIVFQWSIKQGIYQLTYSWDYTWITGLLNAPDKAIKLQKAAAFFCFSLISIFNIIKYLNPESSVRHCWFNCHTNNSHLFSYLCAFPTEIQKARMHQLLSSSGAEQLSWTGLCSCAQHGANPHGSAVPQVCSSGTNTAMHFPDAPWLSEGSRTQTSFIPQSPSVFAGLTFPAPLDCSRAHSASELQGFLFKGYCIFIRWKINSEY